MNTPQNTTSKFIDEFPAVILARNALFEAKQEFERHKATWDEKTMFEGPIEVGFYNEVAGRREDWRFEHNPSYDSCLASQYQKRYSELEAKVKDAEKELDRAYLCAKIKTSPLSIIRGIRSWFRKIEKATRPTDEQ